MLNFDKKKKIEIVTNRKFRDVRIALKKFREKMIENI
jgi:hypothetical protein